MIVVIIMEIRKYLPKDKEKVIDICLKNADIDSSTNQDTVKFIEYTFCRYYIEVEPENCFVAVDDNDEPYGYVYGAADFDKYRKSFAPYLETVAGLQNGAFTADVYVEMYNHFIYKNIVKIIIKFTIHNKRARKGNAIFSSSGSI